MGWRYYPRREWRQERASGPVAAFVLWAFQALAWAFLRLEGPAWERWFRENTGSYPQFHDQRAWRAGDPLRFLVQSLWLMVVRAEPLPRRPLDLSPLLHPLRLLRGGFERGRRRYVGALEDAPEAVAGSETMARLRGRERQLSPRARRWLTLALMLGTALLAMVCITQPFDYFAQFVFVVALWLTAMVIRRVPGRYASLMLIVLSATVSCRYLWWRYTATLNWNNNFDLACGIVLLAAETYSWLVLMLGYVQVAWPLNRKPAPLPADPAQWPVVDVLIPTYNEDLDLVRNTVYAACGLDWPRDRLRIHLLDDGNREEFRRFAEVAGINYIARADNRHAKAGNLNNALGYIDGELVAIFDSDHMPVRSFLQVTVGWFLRDRRLALVQTPHHFFSPDPFERNLKVFRDAPNEGELFYGLVQDGNDLWNASFFCGSCAVLRREALDEIGGFAVETVTEDAHTALRLHRHGWNSAYLKIPQAAGLATGSLGAHVNQRIRWARGMVQIFRLDNPLLGKGLNVFQRLCYANAMLHFLSGIPRLVFLTAPLAFLLLHVYIIYAPALAIVLFVLPHMVHASITNARLQRAYRRPFWGEVYETVLSWYIARPTTVALFSPHRGKFNVTAKDSVQEQATFDWRIARPYIVLAVLNLVGLGFAAWRLLHGPADEVGTVVVSSLWVVYNLVIIGGALAVAAEVHQLRRTHRVSTRLPAAVRTASGHCHPCTLTDYSAGGAGLEFDEPVELERGVPISLLLGRGRRQFVFDGRVERSFDTRLGLALEFADERQRVDFAQCTFARADAWLDWHSGYQAKSLPRSLLGIVLLGWRGYRRIGDFAPAPLQKPARLASRSARWLASFAPRTPSSTRMAADAASSGSPT